MTSAYPSMDQYNDAVQHAGTAFVDPVLKSGKVSTNGLGLPIALGGSFALTYRVTTSGRKFAVRCFHKAAKDLEVRYPRISQTLNATDNQYFVGFEYQTQGVLVNGLKYPIVKMDWVEGDTLGLYLDKNRPLEGTNYKDQHFWSDGLKKMPTQFNTNLIGEWVSVTGVS